MMWKLKLEVQDIIQILAMVVREIQVIVEGLQDLLRETAAHMIVALITDLATLAIAHQDQTIEPLVNLAIILIETVAMSL
jgi:hypothetical protein